MTTGTLFKYWRCTIVSFVALLMDTAYPRECWGERGERVGEWVNGWVSEWVDEWMGEWVNGWVSEWVSEWMSEWVGEWVSGWVSEWVDEWVNEWVSGWVSALCSECLPPSLSLCTFTSPHVFLQHISSITVTTEAAYGIDTSGTTTAIVNETFIEI